MLNPPVSPGHGAHKEQSWEPSVLSLHSQSSHCCPSSCTLPSQKKDKTPDSPDTSNPSSTPLLLPSSRGLPVPCIPGAQCHPLALLPCRGLLSTARAAKAQPEPVPSPLSCAPCQHCPKPRAQPPTSSPKSSLREGQRCSSNKQLPRASPGSSGISFVNLLQNLHEGKEP